MRACVGNIAVERIHQQGNRILQKDPNDWYERYRNRYRLRIGLRGTSLTIGFLQSDWKLAQSNRSTNVTFGGDSKANGPFSKNDDGINVGQAYLG